MEGLSVKLLPIEMLLETTPVWILLVGELLIIVIEIPFAELLAVKVLLPKILLDNVSLV